MRTVLVRRLPNDGLNELTGATNTQSGSYGSLSYLYNANGNRSSETRNGVTVAYTYATNRNRLLDNENQYWQYAATGDAYWSSDAYVMGYDGYGRMVSARSGVAVYEYDAFGRRTRKTVSGVVTSFHYGLQGELLYEQGGGTKSYVYLNNMLLARIDGSSVYYYHDDPLGAPQTMTDSGGNIVWRAEYEPFGKVMITTSAVVNNVRLPGMYADSETGLYYNWNNYYDSKSGRWITADKMSIAEHVQRWKTGKGLLELNPYVPVLNNPLRWTDPTGLAGGGAGAAMLMEEPVTRNRLERSTFSITENQKSKAWMDYLGNMAETWNVMPPKFTQHCLLQDCNNISDKVCRADNTQAVAAGSSSGLVCRCLLWDQLVVQ